MGTLRRTSSEQHGFTLVELLVSRTTPGIKNVTVRAATQGGYCVENTSPGTVTCHKSGPTGDIKSGAC